VIRVPARVPGHDYEVVIGDNLLLQADAHLPGLPGAEKAFVVADQEVASRYLEPLARAIGRRSLTPIHIPIPRGEEAKSLQVADALYRQLALQEAHRADAIVALGGGVAGDLAGFVAATYMRGLPFVQVPTTLTAQVDAAIGGKTAVNLPEGKNLVGSFHQPVAVLADVSTLTTLPDREFRSGLAEVAKYALSLDPDLLEILEARTGDVIGRERSTLQEIVARCVSAKAQIVAADERDEGRRMVLNYGHTLGHALERIDSFSGRSHGEAVAEGMVFAAKLSEQVGVARPGLCNRTQRLLKSLGLGGGGSLPSAEQVLEAMRLDKKYRAGMRFVLLEDVCRPRIVEDVPEDVVRETLEGSP